MKQTHLFQGGVFFLLFLFILAGGWMADLYVEQKRMEAFYTYPENSQTLLLSDETVEKDTFAPREYVKIKSLSG
ncbi:hypothetical protein [Salibacterium halotolerans]|uniref:Uncharacterized protein n=1 Tax=Salibacterium halotolerans TaxID=1884432 RepID=A0A1I5NEM0_9BACI|nr:hypothetical protein [Salibacterium halotolerans]SFP19816.1 hypothetical protein SAMN05518683_10395 [Salibacterium halotolerans]